MWKQEKSEPRPLVDWDKIERLAEWNHNWDPPGELSSFYYWSDLDLKWKERDLSSFDSYGRNSVTKKEESFATGGIVLGHGTKVESFSKRDNEIVQPERTKNHHIKSVEKIWMLSGKSNRIEDAVMEVRTSTNTVDLEELKTKFGWSREVDWHSGMHEYIQIHGERMRVSHAQAKLNNHFGKMYLRVDGRFGLQTANLLHKLDTTHRI